ncbi:MAG: FHA domain-containing serine/threonine-protein kinase [Planctomycetota bacterium]
MSVPADPSPAAPRLALVGDASRSAALPERGRLVIGSSAERADFVIDGQGVDAAHCALGRVKSGGWAVMDLGSKYGTLLNDTPVKSARVAVGDRLLIGSRRLEIVAAGVADPATGASAAPSAQSPAAQSPAAQSPAAQSPAAQPPAAMPPAAPPSAAVRPAARATPAESGAPRTAKRLGGFRLDRQLGRGGMGEVWLALQESLNRPVALKILSTKLAADREFVALFQREARAAAALSHPNVVVVHDVGEADGHHFLAMEFMAGGSLEDRVVRDGPLPWRQVLDALHDAGKGLVYAEERKIVHRDIKPANLMVGGQGTIKIADLGLAMSMAGEDSIEGENNGGGGRRILGTPHFIAPEQARGEPLDHRADLYALGATAYRLLTGKTPFQGETTREILRGHLSQPPVPPSQHVPGLPAGLEELVLTLLAKSPDERFGSAKEMVAAVDRLRLQADNVELPSFDRRSSGAKKLIAPLAVVGALAAGAFFVFQGGAGDADEDGTRSTELAARPTNGDPPDPAPLQPDPDFFETDESDPLASSEAEAALERELRVKDLEAQLAYRDLPRDASRAERVRELRALAKDFPATATAAAVLEEALVLEREIEAAAAERRELGALLEATLTSLLAELRWPPKEGETPRPIESLRQFDAFVPPAELLDTELWQDACAELRTTVLADTTQALEARWQHAETLRAEGDFDALQHALMELTADLELPPLDAEAATDGAGELAALRELAERVRAARERLPLDRVEFAERIEHVRRRELAAALGPDSGAIALFQGLDLAGLEALAARLARSGPGSLGATLGETLAAERADAAVILETLATGWDRGLWRRKTVLDPRDGRRSTIEVLSAGPEGLRFDGSPNELVPWGAFGQDVSLLDQLFKARLTREYTDAEKRGILALLRWSLASSAASAAERAFASGALRSSDASRLESALASVRSVLEWKEMEALRASKLLVEVEACELLVTALEASRNEAWGACVTALEALYRRYDAALVRHLLSDETDWREEDV